MTAPSPSSFIDAVRALAPQIRTAARIGNSNGLLAPPPQEPPQPPAGAARSHLAARRRALWLGLDRRLKMGAYSASGVPWGDGRGTGDVGRRRRTTPQYGKVRKVP